MKNVIYLAVDKDGDEIMAASYESPENGLPYRDGDSWRIDSLSDPIIRLPKGTIKKIIGRTLTWGNEPVKVE